MRLSELFSCFEVNTKSFDLSTFTLFARFLGEPEFTFRKNTSLRYYFILYFIMMNFSPPYESTEEAVNSRRLKKSVTVFTTFDWSKIPRYEERRQMDKPFDSPEIITHVYR